jgi:molybdopterin converting factor small subunit
MLLASINYEQTPMNTLLIEGDVVAFFSIMVGGE